MNGYIICYFVLQTVLLWHIQDMLGGIYHISFFLYMSSNALALIYFEFVPPGKKGNLIRVGLIISLYATTTYYYMQVSYIGGWISIIPILMIIYGCLHEFEIYYRRKLYEDLRFTLSHTTRQQFLKCNVEIISCLLDDCSPGDQAFKLHADKDNPVSKPSCRKMKEQKKKL